MRGGGSDSEGEEEGRYMVDFTRKIVEEVCTVSVCVCVCVGVWVCE